MKPWTVIQYICTSITTFTMLALFDHTMAVTIVFIFWLFIPAIVTSAVSFVCSVRCNTLHKRILLIWHAVNILIFAALLLNPNNKCNADIMEKHYEKYGKQMNALHDTVCGMLNPGCKIEIEFEHGEVSMLNVRIKDSSNLRYWNPSQQQTDSLLQQRGLDRAKLNYIKKELKRIECISITTDNDTTNSPFSVGFRRIGMGKYWYAIYPAGLSADEQESTTIATA